MSAPAVLDLPLPPSRERLPWPALAGSAAALAIAEAAAKHAGPVLVLCAGEQQAYRIEEELRFFADPALPVSHLPHTEVLPYDAFSPHQEILSARLAALDALPRLTRGVVVTTADALIQRLPPRAWLEGRRFHIRIGDKLPPHPFRERLVAAGYQLVSEVTTQGEFAIRGSLIDLFPMGSEQAFRIDLFDDEVESIRLLDAETQRSEGTTREIRLMPAREFPTDAAGIEAFRKRYREQFAGDPSRSRIYSEVSKGVMPGGIEAWLPLFFESTATLFDYLPGETLLVEIDSLEGALEADWKQVEDRHERLSGDIERPLLAPRALYLPPAQALAAVGQYPRVAFVTGGHGPATPVPAGADAVKALVKTPGSRILFIAESAGRRDALLAWLKPLGVSASPLERWPQFLDPHLRFGIVIGPLQDALRLPDGSHLIAEAQVFGLTAPAAAKRRSARVRDPETLLKDLSELREGAPIVHVTHGIGRYRGLKRMDSGGVNAEYLVLEYANNDILYVPVASLGLIHRYIGADSDHAPVHALGSDRWAKAKARAKDRVRDVAAELLQVSARRASRPGVALAVKDEDYQRFAAGFPFQPTADQQKAIDDVLGDMAQPRAMDRVVCGDVGFGKTEVALRASFAAVNNGRQMVVLVPTTLLAEQHHKNFADRYAGTPVRIGAFSRMRSAAEQKALLADAVDGKVDILIGTHRLLQGDLKLKNLGLIIVDEEHRFGVRHKERLKNLRAEVDVLTLTATPIPRTLNMSLSGLRDLSIIATPPEGRLPIKTFVAESERGLVYEACLRELRRGGQIYFLHNEVEDIEKRAEEIRALVPEASVRVAHGQMRERELEQVMLDFYHRRFNLLVCTTIIESGIDVPTANTLIVDRADELGLATLHQLRGRVGRSSHRAYAYFLVPSRRALKADAAKRLEAIEAMGELGSGFLLATHDLEIRGAGELLGEEQSGQIEEVGFTLYADLLGEAVRSLKSGQLSDQPFGESACEVDLGVSALLPDDYIPDVHTRLTLYKRLAEAASEEALAELQVEMVDRFGSLPPAALNLVEVSRLRIAAMALGVVKLRAGSKSITLDFGSQPKVDPRRIIKLIQTQSKAYKLEGQKKLHHYGAFEEPGARAAAAVALLATLGEK